MAVIIHTLQLLFQSTPSVWKATIHSSSHLTLTIYFNPRLPCGRRLLALSKKQTSKRFQSTPSVWKATGKPTRLCSSNFDFNPRLPCGRRRVFVVVVFEDTSISIHAFRVEGDSKNQVCITSISNISIHAFRVEGDSETVPSFVLSDISIHAFRVEGDDNL